MRLLFVTPTLPDRPDKDGMTQVGFFLLRELAHRHAISIWSLTDANDEPQRATALGVRDVRLFPRHDRSLPAYYLHGSHHPYYQTRYESKPLHIALQTLTPDQFDLVILHTPFVSQYIHDIHHLPVVIHAIDALSAWFHQAAQSAVNPLRRHHLTNEARRAQHAELRDYSLAKAVTVVSPKDVTDLCSNIPPAVPLTSIPIGIDDRTFFPPTTLRPSSTIIFTGVMNYPPNVDAALWFTRDIWPAIHSRFPQATFRIVGKNPTKSLSKLSTVPGVVVTGRVASVAEELRSATIAVSPLRFGTGFKIKSIEALACGTPLIASPETLPGVPLTPGKHVLVAESPEAWIVHLTDLLRHETHRQHLSTEGLLLAKALSWSVIAKQYETVYHSAVA